jgi:hypothetical protein
VTNQATKMFVRIALAAILAYAFVSHWQYLHKNVGQRDSIQYWAAGRLFLHGQNPYDFDAVLELEKQQGYKENRPLVLRTPPSSLFMVLPLGLFDAFWAWALWTALSLGSLLLAMRLCWKMYGGSIVQRDVFWAVGYTFAPVPACLVAGQMGLVLLIGVVLFLWWEPEHPLAAGAALILPFAKPHLLVLFWVVVLLWVVARKKHSTALGFAVALAIVTATPWALHPTIFYDYRQMLHQASIGNEFIPALSGVIRLLFFRRWFWVQFIPMMLGLVWGLWFYFKNRSHWDWRRQGLPLMVVSVLTTPYSWLPDEVVLLPAVLWAAVCILGLEKQQEMTLWTRLAIAIFAALDGLLLLILAAKIPFSGGIYFWSSLLWFAWYMYGRKHCRQRTSQ